MVHEITDAEFKSKITDAKGYALIDFWGEGCGPCVQLAPVFAEVAKEVQGVDFYKMDIYANPEVPSSLRIRGIPTMILFKDGKQAAVKVGFAGKDDLKNWIKSETAS